MEPSATILLCSGCREQSLKVPPRICRDAICPPVIRVLATWTLRNAVLVVKRSSCTDMRLPLLRCCSHHCPSSFVFITTRLPDPPPTYIKGIIDLFECDILQALTFDPQNTSIVSHEQLDIRTGLGSSRTSPASPQSRTSPCSRALSRSSRHLVFRGPGDSRAAPAICQNSRAQRCLWPGLDGGELRSGGPARPGPTRFATSNPRSCEPRRTRRKDSRALYEQQHVHFVLKGRGYGRLYALGCGFWTKLWMVSGVSTMIAASRLRRSYIPSSLYTNIISLNLSTPQLHYTLYKSLSCGGDGRPVVERKLRGYSASSVSRVRQIRLTHWTDSGNTKKHPTMYFAKIRAQHLGQPSIIRIRRQATLRTMLSKPAQEYN
ncbi:hypothetical protein BV25DRAFT_1226818 [Artomyces pyxidatus]|uniref:Uncharacterized protein n=1 Tax=Artomyces pyxidatus TaxID=48021 RepID=A0ACB8SPW3_9AGAM|nr:hypothetical protein BV25DRAFT_1226818 [Artomyces pyxidatus]